MNFKEFCPSCFEKMSVTSQNYAMELECSHNLCFECCQSTSPQDLLYIFCVQCNQEQRLKYENDHIRLTQAIQQNTKKIPDTKCKNHNQEIQFFCKHDKTFLCTICVLEHVSHPTELIKCTKNNVQEVFDKLIEVYAKERDTLNVKICALKELETNKIQSEDTFFKVINMVKSDLNKSLLLLNDVLFLHDYDQQISNISNLPNIPPNPDIPMIDYQEEISQSLSGSIQYYFKLNSETQFRVNKFEPLYLPEKLTGSKLDQERGYSINEELLAQLDQIDISQLLFIAQQPKDFQVKLDVILEQLFQIQVVHKDITEEDNIIVNSANSQLNHDGGICKAVLKKGGQIIDTQSDQWISYFGNIPKGCCIVTQGGSLKGQYVIHSIGPVWNNNSNKSLTIKQFETCIVNTLEMANQIGAEVISIPAISTGANSFPREKCAEKMILRIVQWFELKRQKAFKASLPDDEKQQIMRNPCNLRKIRLCNIDMKTVKPFLNELQTKVKK